MRHEQSFIDPVPNIIEDLAKAAAYANIKSAKDVSVTIEVTYLGLRVSTTYNYLSLHKYIAVIGWHELSQAKYPYGLLEHTINDCVYRAEKAYKDASSK